MKSLKNTKVVNLLCVGAEVSVFLFGNAFEGSYKDVEGTVIAIQNAKVSCFVSRQLVHSASHTGRKNSENVLCIQYT